MSTNGVPDSNLGPGPLPTSGKAYRWEFDNVKYDGAQWADLLSGIFDEVLGAFYEQTDPVDDIDRIYRQQEAEAFKALLEDIGAGDKDWRDLAAFEVDFLGDVDGFQEYVDEAVYSATYAGFYEEIENAETDEEFLAVIDEFINAGIKTNPLILRDLEENDTDWDGYYQGILDDFTGSTENPEDQALADLIEEIGQETYDEAVGVLDQIKDQAGAVVDDPIGAIRDIAKNILTAGTGVTLSDECSAAGPEEWIKNCVTFGVILSIPGLEIPSAVLGSIFKGTTIQEMEDVLVAAGKKWEDIKNGTPNCGENNDQECTPEQILKDVGDWVVSKVGEIFEGVDGSGITVESVLGKLGSFLPPAVAAVIYGEITDEINSAIGVPVYLDTAEQCEALGTKEDPNNPGNCLPIDAVMVDCKDANGEVYATVEEGEDCPEPPPVACGENEADFGNGCELVCEYDQTISATDEACVQPVSAVEEECNKQGKVYDELNDECKEECKNTEFVVLADGNCGPPEEPTQCVNNATTASGCEECADGSLPSDHENGDCNQPKIVTQIQCPDNTPNAGQMVDKLSECGEPTNASGYDCTQPRPEGFSFGTVAWNQNCETTHCTDGTLKDNAEGTNCPGYVAPEVTGPEPTSANCDQQDRVTREDGSCGECKPGFIQDPQGFDQCIQAPPECNDCSCAEYAAENPEECTQCPEGESYCEATGQCETAENCPSTTTEEEGGGSLFGGGFGGGGANLFEPYSFAVSADPTLLGSKQFPITDFLAGVFTNSTGGKA